MVGGEGKQDWYVPGNTALLYVFIKQPSLSAKTNVSVVVVVGEREATRNARWWSGVFYRIPLICSYL